MTANPLVLSLKIWRLFAPRTVSNPGPGPTIAKSWPAAMIGNGVVKVIVPVTPVASMKFDSAVALARVMQ